jgi:hypothetical protein
MFQNEQNQFSFVKKKVTDKMHQITSKFSVFLVTREKRDINHIPTLYYVRTLMRIKQKTVKKRKTLESKGVNCHVKK